MNGDFMRVTQQKWLKSLAHVGMLAIATLLAIALASPVKAQTFDQAVANACLVTGVCAGVPGASGGSTTALSRESSPVEERKIERAMGPFNLFISGGYERFRKDVTKFEPGYRTNVGRAILGADYSFSDRFLVGGAFNYTKDDGHFKGGGRFDTDSYGGLLHANFVPAPKAFVDVIGGYSRKNYFIKRAVSVIGVVTGATKGDTDGDEFRVGVNGGYDFNFQNITIGPRVGLNYKQTEIDGYRERGSTNVELRYNDQSEKSLTTPLGLYGSYAISTGIGVLVPQATVEYVHEFLRDQRRIGFSLVADPAGRRFRFQNDRPDRNYFNMGVGVVAVLPQGFAPFVNYRALVGYKDQSSHAVTGGLRIEF